MNINIRGIGPIHAIHRPYRLTIDGNVGLRRSIPSTVFALDTHPNPARFPSTRSPWRRLWTTYSRLSHSLPGSPCARFNFRANWWGKQISPTPSTLPCDSQCSLLMVLQAIAHGRPSFLCGHAIAATSVFGHPPAWGMTQLEIVIVCLSKDSSFSIPLAVTTCVTTRTTTSYHGGDMRLFRFVTVSSSRSLKGPYAVADVKSSLAYSVDKDIFSVPSSGLLPRRL